MRRHRDGQGALMLMQLLAPLIGLLSFIFALLAQIVDFVLLALTDIIGVIRHGLTRQSALLERRQPPRQLTAPSSIMSPYER